MKWRRHSCLPCRHSCRHEGLLGAPKRRVGRSACATGLFLIPAICAGLDLTNAVVVTPSALSGPERKAVTMLVDEVEKRTLIHWPVQTGMPSDGKPAIELTRLGRGPAEGYRFDVRASGAPAVAIAGNDARGVLFGIGRLLRTLHMRRGSVTVDSDVHVETAPHYRLRGHQLGYRPKTNSYDGWTAAMWEQYIRDLAVFGTNALELIPPRSDDDADSPHFPLPPMRMMTEMSRIIGEYGLDTWIWYPAMDKDYSDPKTVQFALAEWGEVFRKLPHMDAVFVPGGDPGHTRPKYLMALLEQETQVLHRYHPKAQMWVSPQSFDAQWLAEFLEILKREPAWLTGVVHGPQVRVSLRQLREAVPARYPIRNYPDITHSTHSQFAVPDWDLAYARTLGREPINPRPTDMRTIFQHDQPGAIGFLTYSEGCNDDVNKIVWSALGWDPAADVGITLRDYARYFIGDGYADRFARGLLDLERNWRGPLLNNAGVYSTLDRFADMEAKASPRDKLNWRFQQALYRAYYDAYTRRRLLRDTAMEKEALERLREAEKSGSRAAIAASEAVFDTSPAESVAAEWRTKIFRYAEALYQSVRMQLSVPLYQAIGRDRGATLDSVDVPLNNRSWLKQRFAEVLQLRGEAERLKSIHAIVNWTDPGPGGFYDDLGDPARQPHLVRPAAYEQDPAYLQSPMMGFARPTWSLEGWRTSWITVAESLFDAPLEMHYTDLDRAAHYKIRIVYGGEKSAGRVIRLVAGATYEIHPFQLIENLTTPVEFDIPPAATADGDLRLTWAKSPGLAGSGRGCQVAEVWLMRKNI